MYSQISTHFTQAAKEKFYDYPFIEYEILNIELGPEKQGFRPHQFDIILASNVLHATADLRKTLSHVKGLLASRGLVIFLETLKPERFANLTVGLTEGWWKFDDKDLRPLHPLLSRDSWLGLLEEAGFINATTVPERKLNSRILSGQALILARGPDLAKNHIEAEIPETGAGGSEAWLVFKDKNGIADELIARMDGKGDE